MHKYACFLILVATTGCKHAAPATASTTPSKVSAASSGGGGGGGGDDATKNGNDCGLQRIHFALDSSDILESEKSLLQKSAQCLKSNQRVHFTIEGNADERGTEEYNLALGDRRATSVAKYLEALGVSHGQVKTVSYGKENPLCAEHDEACWSKNRRAAVRPGAGK